MAHPLTLTVTDRFVPLDLLMWRALKVEVPGLVEKVLDTNYDLAELPVFLPLATQVIVDPPAPPVASQIKRNTVTLWS